MKLFWAYLFISKFFTKIGNFFYHKHVSTLKKKQRLTK